MSKNKPIRLMTLGEMSVIQAETVWNGPRALIGRKTKLRNQKTIMQFFEILRAIYAKLNSNPSVGQRSRSECGKMLRSPPINIHGRSAVMTGTIADQRSRSMSYERI